ncbi:hypothetical protein RHMOL_Rhmol01G0195700 [Rhododendron molle]|uniref:Uncharacterized protein n=1 Tax=Rhododendron molle TaxID=49168 RepID=A0ACC0Q2Z4_RHOML|nr:hypothetical protein RHMOL_Rhmol01G0195700 [Rhododendron molle]
MPTISVGRDRLFEALGRTYSQEEFEDLCFKFGIELDDVTTEKAIIRKEKHLEEDSTEDEEVIYKIEVAANRYDLLCLEGLAQALRIFVGIDPIPTYALRSIRSESMLKMHVKPETSLIRPYVVCAVLRGITFDEARYNSFIDLQDRLHQNICRRRTLVAIGTHDLDTIYGPFTYEYGMYQGPRRRLEDPSPTTRRNELGHRQLDIVWELNEEAVVKALMAVGGGVLSRGGGEVEVIVGGVVEVFVGVEVGGKRRSSSSRLCLWIWCLGGGICSGLRFWCGASGCRSGPCGVGSGSVAREARALLSSSSRMLLLLPFCPCVLSAVLWFVLIWDYALPPSGINFVPLKQVKNFRADELMEFYKVSPIV